MPADARALDPTSPFAGQSEMAARCRAIDWSATSLGPVDDWSPALRTAVRMALESPFAINLWCGPEKILIYNDGYIRVLGAKHPRALARPGREVWSEIWPEVEPMFPQIDGGGPPVYAEDARFIMERASAPPEEAWFTFSLSAIRDERGAIVGYLNVVAETTRRILATRELVEARASAERAEHTLREVFAQAPAFIALLRGPDHVFEFVNDAYQQLVGDREIVGKPVAEALPEVRDQGFIGILDRVRTTGEPYHGAETPVLLARTPGAPLEERFVDFVYQPITDGPGEKLGIVAHGYDVTESVRSRHEIERLLGDSERSRATAQESEERYRFLANAIPVQVWTATRDGAIDYVSDRTAAYFGKTPGDVVGDQWVSVLEPEDVTPALTRWQSSVETGAPYEMEFRLWSAAHQSYRWHLSRATAQRDETGAIIRWFGTNTDIEDAKRSEAELKRLTAEATEANHAKSAFLAAMSHELRTPLNAIGGYAQLIEMGVRGPVTEAQRADLLRIQRSKNHLDALVSEVLNFAKTGSGKLEFDICDVAVQPVLQSVLDMVSPQLADKALCLQAATVPPGLSVTADEDKVRQILLNLLSNALKFTPQGGTIAVDITTTQALVSIAVTDTGIGVPADQIDRIFEPFVQAKRALVATDQGVGLGLAISRQLARAMHGDLMVRSVVDHGSTFTLTLPKAATTAAS